MFAGKLGVVGNFKAAAIRGSLSATSIEFSAMDVPNPKRHMDDVALQEGKLFPYYAGYSAAFTKKLLQSFDLKKPAIVFDPWNGSGTTTCVAHELGHVAVGIDLNPAMVVVAKANHVSRLDAVSLVPLAQSIIKHAARLLPDLLPDDPLTAWIVPKGAARVRAIETAINHTLVSHGKYCGIRDSESLARVSPLAAFFYVALFRTVRRLISKFIPTNPTWVKRPLPSNRKRPRPEVVDDMFLSEVRKMSAGLQVMPPIREEEGCPVSISLGNAEQIALADSSVDVIITSPPYCTRIDYAVATSVELAVLRIHGEEYDKLRRSLTGTSTVRAALPSPSADWGRTCLDFLSRVYRHPSKASQTYYYKNHIQYYASMSNSLQELKRILVKSGRCVLVVQDSFYKDVHNDLPTIVSEMAMNSGLSLEWRKDFSTTRSMVGRNARAKEYLSDRTITESVLCFRNRE